MPKRRHIETEVATPSYKATVEVGLYEGTRLRAVVCFEDNRSSGIRSLDTFAFEAAGAVTFGAWEGNIHELADLYEKAAAALRSACTALEGGLDAK